MSGKTAERGEADVRMRGTVEESLRVKNNQTKPFKSLVVAGEMAQQLKDLPMQS